MIKSFADKDLESCWKSGQCAKIKADLRRRVLMKLEVMDAATCLDDIANTPSCRLHQLHGKEKGKHAISVNGPWRLVFRYLDGDCIDVSLEQYH